MPLASWLRRSGKQPKTTQRHIKIFPEKYNQFRPAVLKIFSFRQKNLTTLHYGMAIFLAKKHSLCEIESVNTVSGMRFQHSNPRSHAHNHTHTHARTHTTTNTDYASFKRPVYQLLEKCKKIYKVL